MTDDSPPSFDVPDGAPLSGPIAPSQWVDLVALEEDGSDGSYDGPPVWQLQLPGIRVSIFQGVTGWTTTAFDQGSYWWQDRALAPAGTELEDAKAAAVEMFRAHAAQLLTAQLGPGTEPTHED